MTDSYIINKGLSAYIYFTNARWKTATDRGQAVIIKSPLQNMVPHVDILHNYGHFLLSDAAVFPVQV